MRASANDRRRAKKAMHTDEHGDGKAQALTHARQRPICRPPLARSRDLSRKASGWFPAGTGPELGKTGAKPEIWQNRARFRRQAPRFPGCGQRLQRGRRERRRGRDQGALRRPRRNLQSVPRQISRGDAPLSEPGRIKQPRLGPAGPARPLAARRPDRVQLVVGRQSPHRLAHLVGLRDPDPACSA